MLDRETDAWAGFRKSRFPRSVARPTDHFGLLIDVGGFPLMVNAFEDH